MSYSVQIGRLAAKEIKKLPRAEVPKIISTIQGLAEDPFPAGCKKLKASDDELYRVRQGNYRIIYAVETVIKIVEVRKVSHKKDAYR
jgi:mRNA interferase RelE/StbE